MRVMNVQIDQQFGRLGLNIQKSQIQLHTTPPKSEVKTPDPKVEIKSGDGSFKVDGTQCREALDLYTPKVLGKREAKQGMRELENWIRKIAQEGDQLARIENGSDMISQLAKRVFSDAKDINIKNKPGPSVKYQKGSIKMNWELHPVEVKLNYGDVQTQASRAKVETYILQKDYIHIGYDGRLIDFVK